MIETLFNTFVVNDPVANIITFSAVLTIWNVDTTRALGKFYDIITIGLNHSMTIATLSNWNLTLSDQIFIFHAKGLYNLIHANFALWAMSQLTKFSSHLDHKRDVNSKLHELKKKCCCGSIEKRCGGELKNLKEMF